MDVNDRVKTTSLRRKATLNVSFCVKKERNASFKKVSRILQKSENDRTEEEKEVLTSCAEVVEEVKLRLEKRNKLKARSEEVEDSREVLEQKCEVLARALQSARHLVVYSGAGVSTAACIPDYRGSNGIWTRLQQGLDIGQHDLSKTQPTLTHMVLYSLYRKGWLKHVVSQNCDGLHLRSGLPRAALSEVHGNMYLEVCQPCKLEYWRLFDVTEHTARYSHATARRCYTCHKPLRDTIVHFGERGGLKWPINWSGATAAANQADVILCIGSSLKVLKKYPWLWGMDRPAKKRPNLYIVNLQWTPKDESAALKINGKCDEIMSLVMKKLGFAIPEYEPLMDPIFVHATRLHPLEMHTYSTAYLEPPEELKDKIAAKPEQAEQENKSKVEVNGCENIKKECPDESSEDKGVKRPVEENDEEVTKRKCPLDGVEIKSEPEEKVVTSTSEEISSCNEVSVKKETVVPEDQVESVVTSKETDNSESYKDGAVNGKEESNIEGKMSTIGSPSNCVKEEPKSDSNSSCSINEQKPVDNKSPTKGIWRPFSFDDCGGSSSSAGGSSASGVKTEPQAAHSNKSDSSNHCRVLSNSSTNFLNQNQVKKCLIQLEPLDLSCSKKLEPVKENPYFCKYCRLNYHSGFCLFYRKQNSETPSNPPCYCCDEDDEKDPTSPETDVKSPDDSSNKVPITNPGWFGKGYRKKIRKKR